MNVQQNLKRTTRSTKLLRVSGRASGFSMAEVASSAFVVIFMMIMAIDVWMLISAVQMNDSACRDAARAAAQGTDLTTAENLAFAAVATHKSLASMFDANPTVDIGKFQWVDYTGGATIPATETPYVSVTTTCRVHPIMPLSVFGTMIIGSSSMTFSQTYAFPLVKSKALPAN